MYILYTQMFTELYLDTTNPHLSITQLVRPSMLVRILFSIVFHILVYTGFVNLSSYIFLGNALSSVIQIRLVASLVVIMVLGFLARFYHVKEIYNAYKNDDKKTREHVDKLYVGWIFIS